jgi:glycerophosphoryl diester phosphodiesterase
MLAPHFSSGVSYFRRALARIDPLFLAVSNLALSFAEFIFVWRLHTVFKSLPSAVVVISFLSIVTALEKEQSHAQEQSGPPQYLAHSHAHNDYEHPRPLSDSLSLGYASIEADVWLVDGELCVAHDRAKVDPSRRLDNLYLDPLLQRFMQNEGKLYATGETLILLVDIKSEAEATYRALQQLLTKYRLMLEVADAKTNPAVKVIVSGNRAIDLIQADKERLVSVDGRLKDLQIKVDPSLMPLISDNYRLHFRYLGSGEISDEERAKLRDYVRLVHQNGAQLRFWGTPENESLWKVLREEQVDFIGTDQLQQLADFLK